MINHNMFTILEKVEKVYIIDEDTHELKDIDRIRYRATTDFRLEVNEHEFLRCNLETTIDTSIYVRIVKLFSNITTKLTEEEATQLLTLVLGKI